MSWGGGRARWARESAPPLPRSRASVGGAPPLTCQRAWSSLLSRLHCIWITWGKGEAKVTHEGWNSATGQQEQMLCQRGPDTKGS